MGIDKPGCANSYSCRCNSDCLEIITRKPAGQEGMGKPLMQFCFMTKKDLYELEEQASTPVSFNWWDPFSTRLLPITRWYQPVPVKGSIMIFEITDFLKKIQTAKSHSSIFTESSGTGRLAGIQWTGSYFFFIFFTVNKDSLYHFQKKNLNWMIVSNTTRAYEGIFDQPTPVSEKVIAGLWKRKWIWKQPQQLHHSGIIEYMLQKDTPQLLPGNRVRAEEIALIWRLYNERKNQTRKGWNKWLNM